MAISEADNNTTKNIERFKKILKERIDKLKQEIEDLQLKLNNDKYLLITSEVDDTCNELQAIDERLKLIEETAA